MKKGQIFINALSSISQIVLTIAIYFILYRYLLNTIGVAQLGLWSLVMASASVTQVTNLGLAGSVVKFVAKYLAHGEDKRISYIIQTATLSIATFIGLAVLLGYPIIKWILSSVISTESISIALSILPIALLALWLKVIGHVILSGLDGYQRIDIRSILLISGAVLNLGLCFVLVPFYGIIGVAYSNVIQNLLVLITGWFALKKQLPSLPFFPYKWDKAAFKEMIGYGINLQIISVAYMFYDPLTKALLSKFGSLSMVGFYEMANKMVGQLRILLISGLRVLAPVFSYLFEKTPEKIKDVYATSYQILFYLALPAFSMLVVFTPLISYLWIGFYENDFVFFGILLCISYFIAILSFPAEVVCLGVGILKWIVIANIIAALTTGFLGYIFGTLIDGNGVVIAWSVAVCLASAIKYISFSITQKISKSELIPPHSTIILFTSFISVLLTIFLSFAQNSHKGNLINIFIINAFLFSIVSFLILWAHPVRKLIFESFKNEILKTIKREPSS